MSGKGRDRQHIPDFVERQRHSQYAIYKKTGKVNGRKLYAIDREIARDSSLRYLGLYHMLVIKTYKWLKPSEVTILLLEGETIEEITWDGTNDFEEEIVFKVIPNKRSYYWR